MDNPKQEMKIIGHISSKAQQYLKERTHCVLCNTELEQVYTRDDAQMWVLEEAHCPTCEVCVRRQKFDLN